MNTTTIHPNASLVQPIYSASGLVHIGTPTWREELGHPVVRLACSGKEIPAARFANRRDFEHAECKKCRKLATA
jgi:hypothetical protein